MTRPSGIKRLAFLSLFFLSVAATNFTQCLIDFQNNDTALGGVDYNGKPVANPEDAVGLTYGACKQWCGDGREPFDWSVFSQQFSAWLLPWLALISQLPFGAENSLDNLISGEFSLACVDTFYQFSHHHAPVALTVGSPTLAAFSLALTAINTRWAYNRFSTVNYPNRRNAVTALVYLQQVPLRLTTRDGLLASLIVLPENDKWWKYLVETLEQTHTWTISAATSIAWVIIAFAFTIVDSFMSMGEDVNSTGQGVGSLWLWLIPIIVGWLWTPVSSYDKLRAAVDRANDLAFMAARGGAPQTNGSPNIDTPRRASDVTYVQAIRVGEKKEVFTRDAARAAPVFNYSRIWEWSSIVETIARAYENADKKAKRHIPVDPRKEWVYSDDKHVANHHDNRAGTIEQVQAYCGLPVQGNKEPVQPVPLGMWKRIFIASVFALGLQWGTTSSAVITVIFTPTSGLGCRSGIYILYGIVSTMIWLTLLLSSYLAHCAKVWRDSGVIPNAGFNSANLAKNLATFLRRLSITAAGCNALSIVLACVFQFSDFYSTCYCNSSVLGRGSRHAYYIIAASNNYDQMKGGWIGGVVLAGGCVVLFLFFLLLMLEPSHDTNDR